MVLRNGKGGSAEMFEGSAWKKGKTGHIMFVFHNCLVNSYKLGFQ